MKDFLVYLGFRLATGMFGLLPEPVMRWIGETGGEIAARRHTWKYPMLQSHMRRVIGDDAPDSQIDAAVHGMYRSYGRYWAETFWFRPRRRNAILRSIDRVNFEPVHRAIAAGRPRIFAVPHVGNWEVAGVVAESIGTPVVAVAEHLPNQHITDWFVGIRNRFGIDIILTSEANRTRSLMRILKNGGAVALLSDRDVTGRGIAVEFFGEETSMPAGPVALADATGADLFPVGAFFHTGAGYRIVVRDPIQIPDLPSREERIDVGSHLLAAAFEELIAEAPSQWHLFQPNWPSDARFTDRRAT